MEKHKATLQLFGAPLLVAVAIQWFLWSINIMHFSDNYDLFGTTFVLWLAIFFAYIVGAGHGSQQ